MKLQTDKESFFCVTTYEERFVPKKAGFWWNAVTKRWETKHVDRALQLIEYADDECKAVLLGKEDVKKEAIYASKAKDAKINIPVPKGLSYLPFQKAGIKYISERPNCLVGDELGLGKTIESIGLINLEPKSIKKVLVICPATLKIHWKREMRKWLTRPAKIRIFHGGSDNLPITKNMLDIRILNYDILHKFPTIKRIVWDLLILDEAHRLKHTETRWTKIIVGFSGKVWAMKGKKKIKKKIKISPIRAKRKLPLTGTPITNRPIELYTILHYLDPKSWPSRFKYAQRYCDAKRGWFGWNYNGASNLDELREKLRATLLLRRLKKNVLPQLPPKRRQIIELPSDGLSKVIQAEKKAWESCYVDLNALRTAVSAAKISKNSKDYEKAVDKLRKEAKNKFDQISKYRHDTAIAKIPQAISFIRDALDSGGDSKIILFAHHHDVQDAILSEFKDLAVLHRGGLSITVQQKAVDRFNEEPNIRLFVGSIIASGVGLNLTISSHEIFIEFDWVPGNMAQAEDRPHRIGQKNSVLIQYLVLEGSLDATMAKMNVDKQNVIEKALDR